jgi:hypothetical protein
MARKVKAWVLSPWVEAMLREHETTKTAHERPGRDSDDRNADYAVAVRVAFDALRPLPATDDDDDDELEPF